MQRSKLRQERPLQDSRFSLYASMQGAPEAGCSIETQLLRLSVCMCGPSKADFCYQCLEAGEGKFTGSCWFGGYPYIGCVSEPGWGWMAEVEALVVVRNRQNGGGMIVEKKV